MPAAAVVTIIAAVVVVLVLAGFLLAVARVLLGINRELEAVIGTVGTITSRTAPVNSVVGSISGNLATAEDGLTSLLASKLGADGAARLVASVDPLAEAPAEEETPRRDREAEPPPSPTPEAADDEPPPSPTPEAGDDEPIRYSRVGYEPATPAQITPSPPGGRGGGEIRLRDREDS
ncbi:MAG: hypothetical protein WKF96_23620 [Solirubrobacteraceae bacterium]